MNRIDAWSAAEFDSLAPALHAAYCLAARRNGETPFGNPSLISWDRLPPALQDSNRQMLTALIPILGRVGLAIERPAPAIPIPDTAWQAVLPLIAEPAHALWCRDLTAQGWRATPGPKDWRNHTHPFLCAWENLPETARQRSMGLLQQLPSVFAIADCGLAPLESAPLTAGALQEQRSGAGMSIPPTAAQLRMLARMLHESYVHHQLATGATLQDNPALRPWEHLAPTLVAANFHEARSLWQVLEIAGFAIVPTGAPGTPFTPTDLTHHLEGLAELMHRRWLAERAAAGWTYAPGPKDLKRSTNPNLLAWEALPPAEREKLYAQIRDWPRLLKIAGWQIIHARPAG